MNRLIYSIDQISKTIGITVKPDTTPEPDSLAPNPPYFKNWYDACATEFTGNCRDFATLYPNPEPMIIDTARLEPDYPTDLPDMVWGQGPKFNDRLIQDTLKQIDSSRSN